MANKKEAYISFRCSDEIKKKLETECKNKEWTMSHTVEKIIKQYFEKEVKKEYRNDCTKCTFLYRYFWKRKTGLSDLFFIVTATFYPTLPKNVIETRDGYRTQSNSCIRFN